MSAPIQASASVQVVPASNWVRSSTRMPDRQPGEAGVTFMADSLSGANNVCWVLLGCRRDGCAAERRHDLRGEPIEVFQLDVERGAERRRANHPVDAGEALFHRFHLLDDV